jgi:hypothetical protein
MPSTYTPIATTTITGSSSTTINFTSIPSTYTDLVLVLQGTANSNYWDLYIRFNSDTGSNYSVTRLFGSSAGAGSNRLTSDTLIQSTYYGNLGTGQSNQILNVMNYANTTTNKTVLVRANNTANGVDASVGLYRSTAAINAINLLMFSGGSFQVGTTATLYGIKAA